MIEITDRDLLLQLTNKEDGFVERKTVSDLGDSLKTVVAFANTVPIGHSAVLFVGVRDDGEPEGTISDLDKIQQRLSKRIADAYPTIYVTTRVLNKDGKQFLAVIVPGSTGRPHFAGQAYIRDGAKSVVASDAQFDRLVAERSAKTYEILKSKGKVVTFTQPLREYMLTGSTQWTQSKHIEAIVCDCNSHYVILANAHQGNQYVSYPLGIIELNYDTHHKRLELRLLEGPLPSSF